MCTRARLCSFHSYCQWLPGAVVASEEQEQDGEQDWTVPAGPTPEEKLAKEKAELRKRLLESWDEKRSSKHSAFKLSESNRLDFVATPNCRRMRTLYFSTLTLPCIPRLFLDCIASVFDKRLFLDCIAFVNCGPTCNHRINSQIPCIDGICPSTQFYTHGDSTHEKMNSQRSWISLHIVLTSRWHTRTRTHTHTHTRTHAHTTYVQHW